MNLLLTILSFNILHYQYDFSWLSLWVIFIMFEVVKVNVYTDKEN